VAGVNITGDPTIIITTAQPHGLANGNAVSFSSLLGSTELNGNSYVIANVSATTFEVTQASTTAYTGGGTWVASSQSYGTINYKTGVMALDYPTAPDLSATLNIWYYTYTASRPVSVLWWKNELIIRPVPDKTYRIEVEAYKYPDQFSDDAETPILKQWWQYLALLASMKILNERQDVEGMQNIAPMLERQERLVRNRTANEQIGQRNSTIYQGSGEGTSNPLFQGYW